tara:strand:- start:2241 stop:2921 length:681 start_codon:yes stop_codon:yes gene_type:complete
MTDHILVEDSYVESLVKNAAWDMAKVPLTEKKDSGQKKGDKPAKGKKGDKPAKGKKGDKPDFTTGARKGDKSKTHPDEDDYDEMKESTEHVCPLCESVLENELSDEQIMEHVAQIQELFTINEGDDEGDDDKEPTDADLDAIEKEKNPPKNEQSDDPKDPANKKKVARVAGGESDFDDEGLSSKKKEGDVDPTAAKAHALAKKGQASARSKVEAKVKNLKAAAKGS